MPRWREQGTCTGLTAAPANQGELTPLQNVIALWNDASVDASNQGKTGLFGCDCGAGGTRKAKGNCCEWASRRIDRQRAFTVGGISSNSYNLQWGDGSYAAVNIQCNVNLTAAVIRAAFTRSMTNRQRIWLGNAAGHDACFGDKKRKVEEDP